MVCKNYGLKDFIWLHLCVLKGEGYIDARDLEWSNDGDLVPVDLNKVSGRLFVVIFTEKKHIYVLSVLRHTISLCLTRFFYYYNIIPIYYRNRRMRIVALRKRTIRVH